jgi:hypothetical protein
VVPYPEDCKKNICLTFSTLYFNVQFLFTTGSEATDHRRPSTEVPPPSPRQLDNLLIGAKGKFMILGEFVFGLSLGLADTGECDRGDVCAKLSLCIATAELLEVEDGIRRDILHSFYFL